MNITTIIELENQEVEQMVGAKMVFLQEEINDQIIQTCVECFEIPETNETIDSEEVMERVFLALKEKGVIPAEVNDFSFEMPSCERIKACHSSVEDVPQNVVISFAY